MLSRSKLGVQCRIEYIELFVRCIYIIFCTQSLSPQHILSCTSVALAHTHGRSQSQVAHSRHLFHKPTEWAKQGGKRGWRQALSIFANIYSSLRETRHCFGATCFNRRRKTKIPLHRVEGNIVFQLWEYLSLQLRQMLRRQWTHLGKRMRSHEKFSIRQ